MTSEMLEAQSWLGRGALAAKQYNAADRYAMQTEQEVAELLKRRRLDPDEACRSRSAHRSKCRGRQWPPEVSAIAL